MTRRAASNLAIGENGVAYNIDYISLFRDSSCARGGGVVPPSAGQIEASKVERYALRQRQRAAIIDRIGFCTETERVSIQ